MNALTRLLGLGLLLSHLLVGAALATPVPERATLTDGPRDARFEIRQVLTMDGYGRIGRSEPVEVRTTVRQQVRDRGRYDQDLTITVLRIALYQHGRYLGDVDEIPRDLRTVRVDLRNGRRPDVNRMLYLAGSARDGFELIAAPYDPQDVLDGARRPRAVEAVGVLDLRRERVYDVRGSRLVGPGQPYVGVALLPGLVRAVAVAHRDDQWDDRYDRRDDRQDDRYDRRDDRQDDRYERRDDRQDDRYDRYDDDIAYGAVYDSQGWGGGTARYDHRDDRGSAWGPRPDRWRSATYRFADTVTALNGFGDRLRIRRDVEVRPVW